MQGVYKIINSVNGRSYIGSSIDIKKRYGVHMSKLRYDKHNNKSLQQDFNLLGEEVFSLEVVEKFTGDDLSELRDMEQLYLEAEFQTGNLYNEKPCAMGQGFGEHNPLYGRRLSEDHRKKIGVASKKYATEDRMNYMRSKITTTMHGKTHTKETKARMSAAHKGRTHSEDSKELMRINNANKSGIMIDGIKYISMSEASRVLGISRTTITSRVNNPKFKNYLRCSESVETNCKPEISAG